MRLVMILTAFFIFSQGCRNCDCPCDIIRPIPKGNKEGKATQIMVSINKRQELFIGTNKVENSLFDSLLKNEIRLRRADIDTPTVVINADTAAQYGVFFNIMRTAKKEGAKVVTVIRDMNK